MVRAYPRAVVELRGLRPEEELRGIKDAKAKIKQLSDIDGLAVAPELRGQVFLRYGGKDVSATMIGIDPERERRVSNIERDLVAGRLDNLYTSANGVILGAGLAERIGAGMGDTLSVISPAGVIILMKVVGLFRTGIVSLDNFECYALLKKAQILQNRPNVINRISMHLDDVDRAEAVAARVEGRYGYWTEPWQETNQNILGLFVIQNAVMYSTVGAILVVAGFGIFNIISTVIFEKSRDIAILKSIGLGEWDIRSVFLVEGLVIGAVGGLMGWGLGYGLVRLLASVRFEIEGFIRAEGFVLYYSLNHYLLAGLFALVTAAIAAYLPARKAARLNPVDIIRGAA